MKKKQIIIGLIIISLFLTPLIIIPNLVFAKTISDSIIIYSLEDTVVIAEFENNNYGYDEFLNVQTSNISSGDPYYNDCNEQTYLKFDYSVIINYYSEQDTLRHHNTSISLALLRVYCYETSNLVAGVTDIEAWSEYSDGWTEEGLTWGNKISTTPYLLEDTVVPAVGWVEWDVTRWLQEEWESHDPRTHNSYILMSKVEGYDIERRYSRFTSKEECVICTDDDPYLYVEYTYDVPPPIFDFWFMKYILAFIIMVAIVSFAIYVKGGKRY